MAFALILAAAAVCANVHTPRGAQASAAFRRANPCPDGPDKGSKTKCQGYVVDHVVPLCAGGKDAVSNMAWQTEADGHAKDKAEDALCAWIRKVCK